MLDTDTAREYVRLAQRRKELDEEIDEIKARMQQLEEPLLKGMIDEGVETFPVKTEAGQMTLYVHRQIWAKAKEDREACCKALTDAGLGEFVTSNFNTHTVSAYFRGLLADGDEVPQGILKSFDLNEFTTLRARRSGSAPSASKAASQNLKKQISND